MSIGIYNIDNDLRSELSKSIEIYDLKDSSDFPKLDGLVIDWVNKENDSFLAQAAIIEHYVRESIPVVIYDRFMCVTPKEHGWLKKFNVTFLEPALNNRIDFEYLPQWTNLTYKIEKTQFDLGYIGKINRRVKLFEKYYVQLISLWPDKTIKFESSDVIDEKKIDEWNKSGIFFDLGNEYNFKFSVLIDSPHNIDIGYLPNNLFEMMKHGVMVLCPVEQKYFQGMFPQLLVKKPSEVEYFIKSFDNLREVVIEEVYENIQSNYPEFTIEYACDIIKRKLMI